MRKLTYLNLLLMKKLILMLMAIVCFTACSNDENEPKTQPEPTEKTRAVELNDTTLAFELNADTTTIDLGSSEGWWIDEITTDEGTLKPTAEEKQLMEGGGAYEAKCQWVSVKRNGSSIEVAVDDNVNKERTFKIILATADTTATITGVQEEMITGKWDDNIGLSTKTVTLNGAGDPVTVTTEGKHWWITSIEVDGETLYNFSYDNTENRNMYQTGIFNLKCGWLNVSVDDWTLNISADMNYGAGRTFKIYLQAGDYHDCIDGTQEELMTGGASDKIGLSTKEITLDYTGSEVKIDTEGKSWWITSIEVEGETLYNFGYDRTENRNMYQTGKFNQQCDWLNVRVDDWTLYISADNNFRKDRTFKITLELGNYFDRISGTQKAKDR